MVKQLKSADLEQAIVDLDISDDTSLEINIDMAPEKKRHLVRWTEDLDQQLLLIINYVCNRSRIEIPWSEVAQVLGQNTTGAAIQQHIAKTRQRREQRGLPVPPPNSRGGGPRVSNNKIHVSKPATNKYEPSVTVVNAPAKMPHSYKKDFPSNDDYDSSNPDADYKPTSAKASLLNNLRSGKAADYKMSEGKLPLHGGEKHKRSGKAKLHNDEIKVETMSSNDGKTLDDDNGGVGSKDDTPPKVGAGAAYLQLQEDVDEPEGSSSCGDSAKYSKKTVPRMEKQSLICVLNYSEKPVLKVYVDALFDEVNEIAFQSMKGNTNTSNDPVTENWAQQMEGFDADDYDGGNRASGGCRPPSNGGGGGDDDDYPPPGNGGGFALVSNDCSYAPADSYTGYSHPSNDDGFSFPSIDGNYASSSSGSGYLPSGSGNGYPSGNNSSFVSSQYSFGLPSFDGSAGVAASCGSDFIEGFIDSYYDRSRPPPSFHGFRTDMEHNLLKAGIGNVQPFFGTDKDTRVPNFNIPVVTYPRDLPGYKYTKGHVDDGDHWRKLGEPDIPEEDRIHF